MPRRLRHTLQGAVFHVMNRAVRNTTMFSTDADYDAFFAVVRESLVKSTVKVIAYCLMPTHWHFVMICERVEDLSNLMHRVEGTHANRWNGAHGTRGTGCLYKDRFKAVPVQTNRSLIRVCRYVERNAVRKGLVPAADQWPWGSLYAVCENCHGIPLEPWPIPRPSNWIEIVNRPDSEKELADLRKTIRRNQPIGDPAWQRAVAPYVGLSMRPIGRPKKDPRPL